MPAAMRVCTSGAGGSSRSRAKGAVMMRPKCTMTTMPSRWQFGGCAAPAISTCTALFHVESVNADQT